jgi:hypothetical protein
MRAVEPAGRGSVRLELAMPPRRRGVRRVDTFLVAAEAFSGAIVRVRLLLRDCGSC